VPGPLTYDEKHWLEYGTDYAVSRLEQQDTGGILTLLKELPPEAEQIVIRRVTPKTQETDLHNGARLPAELIEGIGDKATMEIQEIAEQMLTKDDRQEIEKTLNEAIENERVERIAADEAEAAAREAADIGESIARISADQQLQHNIDAEAQARQDADQVLQLNINNEAQARQNQDVLLQQHIDQEAAARIQADQGLHNEVIAEEAARQQAVNNLDIKKQDRLPDEVHPLIDSTGKLNMVYIPASIIGAKKYGGVFGADGIIEASDLAPELSGIKIDDVPVAAHVGFYFTATAEYSFYGLTFHTNDNAVCQGNNTPNWIKIDNTDDVQSVNGKIGAVVLTKEDLGLQNVLNEQQVPASEKGQPSGVPTLDENGKIPFSQIPEISTVGFGIFKFYIPQEGPKAKHLILRYPATTEPPDIYIDRNQNSPTQGHLIWNTQTAGEVDLGDVATPLVQLENKIGDLAQLETEAKDNLVDAINEVNETAGVVQKVDNIEPEEKNVQLRHAMTRAQFEALKADHEGKAPAGRYIITDEGIDDEETVNG
jgi:hypothetical protein